MNSTNAHSDSRFSRSHEILVVVIITVFAGGLRITKLDAPSLWADEISTVRDALAPNLFLSKRLGFLPTQIGLQAYGLGPDRLESRAFHTWRDAGLTEFKARIPSAVVGTLTIPLVYLAARTCASFPVAAVATLLLAFAHWHILWSQSARFYSLQFLFYTTSLLTYFGAMQRASLPRFILAAVLAGLAFLSQPTAAIIFLIFAGDFLIRWRQRSLPGFARMLFPIAGVGVIALVAVMGWDIYKNPDKFAAFFQKPNQQPLRIILATVFYILPPIVVAAGAGAYLAWRNRDPLATYLVLACAVPPVAFAIVGLFGFVEVRYGLIALFPCLLLAAIACQYLTQSTGSSKASDPERRALSLAPVLILLAVESNALFGYYTEGGYRSRIREALLYVKNHQQRDDLICAEPQEAGYYLSQPADIHIFDLKDNTADLDRRTWIIWGAGNHGNPPEKWIRENTRLMAQFDTHVVGPSESIKANLYDPAELKLD